jgi:hypothetical protein
MRVIVDEGTSKTSPLWHQFQAWLGKRPADIVWLEAHYPAMPDVEILDKLMAPDTVLLTRDRVLHNRALAQGMRSFTLDAQGQFTCRPLSLAGRRLRAQAPSVLKGLKLSYQHEPHPIALALSANRPPWVLKTQRTRRRRIRSHFGSVDNIARVAWTIGARPYQGRLLCGYVMHVEGYRGVKGLRASEGYGVDRAVAPEPAQSLVFALCEVFQLHLQAVRHEMFIIPPAAYELARDVMRPSCVPDSPLVQTLNRLVQATAHMAVSPCVKGRFYDQMQRKLEQLATAPSNEIVALDFGDTSRRLAI